MQARPWVFRALLDVISDQTYSNLYLKDHLQEVDEKDQKLAVRIFYGSLQNWTFCQSLWKPFARSKVGKKADVLLTMSTYQLHFLDKVPAYAIINDANRIAERKMPEQKGMINAILRKVAEIKPVWPQDPVEALALKTSLPDWLIRMWVRQYGPREAFACANATLSAVPVFVRINPMRISAQQAALIDRLQPGPDGLLQYTGAHIASDPLYRQGKISVQDPGSYAIAKMVDPTPGEKILDVCAAPGTKTMAMAELSSGQAQITACDLHEHRVRLIEQDARRLGLKDIHAKVQDALELEDNPVFDAVLCDVPCSGYGILARKPDMKLRLDPSQIDQLVPLQQQILEKSALQVKEGGRLIYSTCTIDRKENEKQVEQFLQKHPEFSLSRQETIFPGENSGGFYMAKLVRTGSTEK